MLIYYLTVVILSLGNALNENVTDENKVQEEVKIIEDEHLIKKKHVDKIPVILQNSVNALQHGMELNVKKSLNLPSLKDTTKQKIILQHQDEFDNNEKIIRELSNSIGSNVNEENTVHRFIVALNEITYEEKFQTKNEKTLKPQIKGNLGKQCKDVRKDCLTFQEYCTVHRITMKEQCAKTCGFCYDCNHDEASEENCLKVKSVNLCSRIEAIKYCSKTCDLCGNKKALICENSVFGCCWDRKTGKDNIEGSNCPKCKEKFQSVCQMFKNDCTDNTGAGDWMRKYCQVTCGVCTQKGIHNEGKCLDDPDQYEFCGIWKSAGWCEAESDLMKSKCAKTCNICNS